MPKNNIYKGKDGRWRYKTTGPDGTRRQIVSHKTETKAEFRARCDALDKVGVAKAETLDDIYALWLDQHVTPKLAPSELRIIPPIYDKYVRPYIGWLPLHNITKPDVRRCLVRAYDDKVSASYLSKIKGCITRPINWANSELGLDLPNPCQGLRFATPERHNKERRRVILPEDWEVLKNMSQGSKYRDYYILLYGTGLRPSEGLGVKAQDIDRGYLHIRRGVTIDGLSTLKTASSLRDIPLTGPMQQLLDKAATQARDDWLFATVKGLPSLSAAKCAFWRLNTKASELMGRDFNYTLYDFRHTFATRMAEAGMPLKALQAIMGHVNIKTTMSFYVDVTPDMMDQARGFMGL